MRNKIITTALILVTLISVVFGDISCKSNNSDRIISNVIVRNFTEDYCLRIKIDNIWLNFGRQSFHVLRPGETEEDTFVDLDGNKEVIVEYHKVIGYDKTDYEEVASYVIRKQITFSREYDYKFTITEDEGTAFYQRPWLNSHKPVFMGVQKI